MSLLSREVYRRFLALYPEPFRQEFGNEMLDMFEACAAVQGSWNLLADLVFSAFKQQFRYLSTPSPKSTPLYREIGSSPNLARVLAVAGCGAAILFGVFTTTGESKTPGPQTAPGPEHHVWIPRVASGDSCSQAVEPVRIRRTRARSIRTK
jgi:hypothetical protein